MALDGLEEFDGNGGIVLGAIDEGLDVAFDEGQRRAQFMADIGDEFLSGVFELFETREIVKNEQAAMGPRIGGSDEGGIDLEDAFFEPGKFQFVIVNLFFGGEPFDNRAEFVEAKGFDDGFTANINLEAEQFFERLIGQNDAAIGVKKEETFDHAIEKGLLLGVGLGNGLVVARARCRDFVAESLFPSAPAFSPEGMDEADRYQEKER